jgi:protein subunit release factor A
MQLERIPVLPREKDMREKTLILSLSKAKGDFRVEPYKGSGNGGQKRNKTMSACRIYHDESGAVGQSEEERQFFQNRKIAFTRMINSEKFRKWHKLKTAEIMGVFADIENEVEREIHSKNVKIEVLQDGKWIEAN